MCVVFEKLFTKYQRKQILMIARTFNDDNVRVRWGWLAQFFLDITN